MGILVVPTETEVLNDSTPAGNKNPIPNDGTYTSRSEYDALNRPVAVTAPDGSIYRPTFNEANLLDRVDVNPPAPEDNAEQTDSSEEISS